MTRNLGKLWAFLKRDFQSEVSYRVAFLFQLAGMFFSVTVFHFVSKVMNPAAPGFNGIDPFPWILVGLAFQYYFSAALFSFSAKIRNEQVLGTLEAMLVSPTPTSLVIFSSAAWDFAWGGMRVVFYLLIATVVFGVQLHFTSLPALALGTLLTLLSSAGLGILSASFVLYFKRGDPVNFFLSALTTLFGSAFFPVEQLPERYRFISSYIPITWSLRIVRGSLLQGRSLAELRGDLAHLAVLTLVLVPLGLVCSRFAIRRAKREGSLVQY